MLMRVLVLGGTLFLGRHVVAAALARGHDVTTFNRGLTNRERTRGVNDLHGDRDGDVGALNGGNWDLVIDTSAYHPRHVTRIGAALRGVGRYVLVSTASVYREWPPPAAPESTPTVDPLWDDEALLGPANYARLKRACEVASLNEFHGRAVIVRPGVLVGPLDPSNRFSYWVRRVAAGGEVLCPGIPNRPIQLLDARDLAEWLVSPRIELDSTVLNVAGPAEPLTMGEMLAECRRATNSEANFTWVDETFLLNERVEPWIEVPLWIPAEASSVLQVDHSRARAAGFRYRPLAETITDILAQPTSSEMQMSGGLSSAQPITRERERNLLSLWHSAPRASPP